MSQLRPKRYLILAPMPIELRPVVRAFRLRPADDGTRRGGDGRHELIAALAGIGPDAASATTERLLGDIAPDHVVVVGVAGGLRPGLPIGSLVIPAEVATFGEAHRLEAARLGGVIPAGAIVTTADLITDPAVHAEQVGAGFVAVDMETAAIATACERHGVPWTAFRGISDHVDDGLLGDPAIIGVLGPDGAPRPGRALRLVLRRPGTLRTFAALASGTRSATTVATRAARAAILGDD